MIFWKYIKGYNNTNSNPLWSFISFETKTGGQYGDLTKAANIPLLKLSNTNDLNAATDLGHFIVQKGTDQSIDNRIEFKGGFTVTNGTNVSISILTYLNNALCIGGSNRINFNAVQDGGNNFIQYQTTGSYGLYLSSATSMTFKISGRDYSWYFLQNDITRMSIDKNGITVAGSGKFTNGVVDCYALTVDQTIYAGSGCSALYFNSRSDRRAKTDIQPLLIDALDLVRKTNLYSFRYKETDTPSIGIIAQDVQDIDIQGFKLVDNEEATGKDLDYMTIHESKLTYILWKAIQEQQELIEELQKEIKELKKN